MFSEASTSSTSTMRLTAPMMMGFRFRNGFILRIGTPLPRTAGGSERLTGGTGSGARLRLTPAEHR